MYFSFFFCSFGVDDVLYGQCHKVGQLAEGGGELVVMEGVDVADNVVGEAGYLPDVVHKQQACGGGGAVYDFLQIDGGGLHEVGIQHDPGTEVGSFLFFFGGERAEQIPDGYLPLGLAQSGKAADFLHGL